MEVKRTIIYSNQTAESPNVQKTALLIQVVSQFIESLSTVSKPSIKNSAKTYTSIIDKMIASNRALVKKLTGLQQKLV